MSGSRLPVGSSAMISRGSWTSARAMAVRCCSPPDSCDGDLLGLGGQPDDGQHAVDRRPDLAPRDSPVTSSAKATFSQTVLVGSSLKSWKMIPILRRIWGTWRRRQAGQVLAVEHDLAAARDLVADEQLDQGRLAGAGRSDEEHEVALGDDQVHVAQGDLAVRVAAS